MSDTQIESLNTLVVSGRAGTVDAAVLANIKALGPICRDVLCVAAQVRISTACGAINRLMKRGEVVEHGTVWNHTTRRNVKAYKAAHHEEEHPTP
jgi:hypothetical protein